MDCPISKLLTQQQLTVVLPVFNESEILNDFLKSLVKQVPQWAPNYDIVLIDDGSQDNSAAIAQKWAVDHPITVLPFVRNFGKEMAITAGLKHAKGDAVIIMDADFQHPIDMIPKFIQAWQSGYHNVYAVQSKRDDQPLINRAGAHLFYWLFCSLMRVNVPAHAGDFRLLSRELVVTLNSMTERLRFMKGLYAWPGYDSMAIIYQAPKRAQGNSRWGLGRLISLALSGVVSFSTWPLQFAFILGALIALSAFTYGGYILISAAIYHEPVRGLIALMVMMLFFGGLNLIFIGVLGAYVAAIFEEVKGRPPYLIKPNKSSS
jgi:glycosyltransferase involved in cell wall biosynthesis